jgi:hypothetical protein
MRVTVKDLGAGSPNRVFVPEENDGSGRYYEAGESLELAADRARTLIDLGYVEEAKATSAASAKKET